jgi:hypothetical protein
VGRKNGISCFTGKFRFFGELGILRDGIGKLLGESTAIQSSRGIGIEWAPQDLSVLSGAKGSTFMTRSNPWDSLDFGS